MTFVGRVAQRVVMDANEDWYEPEPLNAYWFDVERVYAGDVDSTYRVLGGGCAPEYRFDVGARYLFSWPGPRFEPALDTRIQNPTSEDSVAWMVVRGGDVKLQPLTDVGEYRATFRRAATFQAALALVAPEAVGGLPDTASRERNEGPSGLAGLAAGLIAVIVAAALRRRVRRRTL